MIRWIASLPNGREVPLHISRFFPQFHMTDRNATDVDLIYRLAEIAREELHYVYTGNC
jgi:pyruvate formate lyase activating enzyme